MVYKRDNLFFRGMMPIYILFSHRLPIGDCANRIEIMDHGFSYDCKL